MQTRGQRWTPKSIAHLNNAKEHVNRHEIQCFDEELGKYGVTTVGGTTSNGEVWDSRTNVVLLDAFSCGCGKLDSTTFHILIMLPLHVIATLHLRAGTLGSSLWRA
jgi:hypothetical protein